MSKSRFATEDLSEDAFFTCKSVLFTVKCETCIYVLCDLTWINKKERRQNQMANVVLIGMPGCGKSTAGVLLAKELGMDFLDTDVILQAREGRLLQGMIDEIGIDAFLSKEQEAVLSLRCDRTVIATGGSVVYGEKAMRHLHTGGLVVYIETPYEQIERRLSNLATRGVTLREGQTLRALYDERAPLYLREADVVFHEQAEGIEQTVRGIRQLLAEEFALGMENVLKGTSHGC